MTQFTEKAIIDSFLKLLNERPLDKITIKDIVEDCGINRNTFYYHFEDIPSLVKTILNTETQKAFSEHGDMVSWEDSFLEASQFALQNKKVVYHIYNSVRREEVEQYLSSITQEVMRQYVETEAKDVKASEEDKALIVSFYKSALVGMILDWLNTGMQYEPQQVVKRLGSMLEGNIKAALKRVEDTETA